LSGRMAGEPPPTLIDYLPENSLIVIDESHVTVPQLNAMYRGDRSRKENLVEYGFRLPSALDNRPLRFDEFEKLAKQIIFLSATPGSYEDEKSSRTIDQVVRPTGLIDPIIEVRAATTQIDDLMSEIRARALSRERVLVTTLTKRMSEDLCDYFSEHEIRVRYLHSDIETLERVEILRDLRLGVFDALIGINLLREGLDLPEVSLVAILDADKEGFLRSTRSLIQTIGRAARNVNGKAILYADTVTGSMKRAIDETERRRRRQHDWNQVNNISPRTIKKNINDLIDGVNRQGRKQNDKWGGGKEGVLSEEDRMQLLESPKRLSKKLKELEKKMYRHAENLEFEEAASLRDEILSVKRGVFGEAILTKTKGASPSTE